MLYLLELKPSQIYSVVKYMLPRLEPRLSDLTSFGLASSVLNHNQE